MSANGRARSGSLNPLIWVAAAFAAGIVVSGHFEFRSLIFFAFGSACALAALVFREKQIGTLLILFAFTALGGFAHSLKGEGIAEHRLKRLYDGGAIPHFEPVRIEAAVRDGPEPAPGGYFFLLDALSIEHRLHKREASGRLQIFVPIRSPEAAADLEALELAPGTEVRIACLAEREDRFLNPGVMRRPEMLDQQGIDLTATLQSPLLIEKLGSRKWPSPLASIKEYRRWLIGEITRHFSTSTAGVLIAAVLGDRYFLDRQTAEFFREGGTFHILVISGLHITFLGGLVIGLARRITADRLKQFAFSTSVIWTYAFAVGAETPVVRAAAMFTAVHFAYAIGRESSILNALGLVAIGILIWDPEALFGPSFQLTFASVAAIVGLGFPFVGKLRSIGDWTPSAARPFPPDVPRWLRRFCETLYWRPRAWELEGARNIWSAKLFKTATAVRPFPEFVQRSAAYLFEGVIISLAVQILLLPFLVHYFHRVTPISVILNLWAGAVLAAEALFALLGVAAGIFSDIIALPFVQITEMLNSLLLFAPGLFTETGMAGHRVPVYSGAGPLFYGLFVLFVLFIACVINVWDPFEIKRSATSIASRPAACFAAVLAAAALGAIIVLHPFSEPVPDGRLRIDLLDVGQGDAALLTFPNGETMLIDGGGSINFGSEDEDEGFEPDIGRIGELVVSEFLWERGYSSVDHIVASHADADHAQGLADVVRNFGVRRLYVGAWPAGDREMDELLSAAARYGVTVTPIGRGDDFEIAGVRVEAIWPDSTATPLGSDNNSSLVLRVSFGDHTFLFAGDIEREAEAAIVAGETRLKANVVKVPHHGSRTSSTSEFVAAVGAELAVIPVGRRSRFGHPHPETVERWKASGARVLKTGEKGTVTITTDGRELRIETFKP